MAIQILLIGLKIVKRVIKELVLVFIVIHEEGYRLFLGVVIFSDLNIIDYDRQVWYLLWQTIYKIIQY